MQLCVMISVVALAVAAMVGSTSAQLEYVHSNDTLALELDSTVQQTFYGPAGSIQTIKYKVINRGGQAHIRIR